MSVYSVNWCAQLFFHSPSILPSLPPTNLSGLCFSLICCVFHLGHPQPILCVTLLLCYLRANIVVPSRAFNRHRISFSVRHFPLSSATPSFWPSCKLQNPAVEKSLLSLASNVGACVPAEPCPRPRAAVPTMSPASCIPGSHPVRPTPTRRSPPPARPTGQRRGWCGCHRRNTALRWASRSCSPANCSVCDKRSHPFQLPLKGFNKSFLQAVVTFLFTLSKCKL